MAVGYPQDKSTADARAVAALVALREACLMVQRYKAWLDTIGDPALQAAPFNYGATDVANLRSAFVDADEVRQGFEGLIALTQRDRRAFAKLLWAMA